MKKLTLHKIESAPLRRDVLEAMLEGKNINKDKIKKIFIVGTLVIVVAIGMTLVINNIGDISEIMKYNPNKIILAMMDTGRVVEGAEFFGGSSLEEAHTILKNAGNVTEVIKEGAVFFAN